jgi:hypothetical protein
MKRKIYLITLSLNFLISCTSLFANSEIPFYLRQVAEPRELKSSIQTSHGVLRSDVNSEESEVEDYSMIGMLDYLIPQTENGQPVNLGQQLLNITEANEKNDNRSPEVTSPNLTLTTKLNNEDGDSVKLNMDNVDLSLLGIESFSRKDMAFLNQGVEINKSGSNNYSYAIDSHPCIVGNGIISGSLFDYEQCIQLAKNCENNTFINKTYKLICDQESVKTWFLGDLVEAEVTVACCSSGICTLGKRGASCNKAEATLLNLGQGTENNDAYSIMSNISRVGIAADSIVDVSSFDKMEPALCGSCWRAAHDTNMQLNQIRDSYEKDKAIVLSLMKSTKTKESIRKRLNIKLKDHVLRVFGPENVVTKPEWMENGIECFTAEDVKRKKKECGSDVVERDVEAILSSFNISTEDVDRVWNADEKTNEIRKKRVSQNKTRTYLFSRIQGDDLTVDHLKKTCIENNKGKAFDLISFINKLIPPPVDTVKATFAHKRSIEFAVDDSKYISDLLGIADADIFCKDEEYSKNLKDLRLSLTKIKEPSATLTRKKFCPSEEVLAGVICKKPIDDDGFMASFPSDDTRLQKLSSGQSIILSEYICKGKASITLKESPPDPVNGNGRNGKVSDEERKVLDERAITSARAGEVIRNNPGIIEQRNFRETGDAILSRNVHAGKDLGVTDSDLGEASSNFDDTSSDFLTQMDILTSSTSPFSKNANTNDLQGIVDKIEIDDVLNADLMNPSIGEGIEKIASEFEATDGNIDMKESKKAAMDYLTDSEDEKDSASVIALKSNEALRTELDALKQKIKDEKTIAGLESSRNSANKELEAAQVRIKNLERLAAEGNYSNSKSNFSEVPSQGAEQQIKQGGAGEDYTVDFSASSGRAGQGLASGRNPASDQLPVNSIIPPSVQDDLVTHANAQSGIVFNKFKKGGLYLLVDQTDYPLNIEEVVVENGIISGIKIQNRNSKLVTLNLAEMEEESQIAVRNFIKSEGDKILIVENKNLVKVTEKLTTVSNSYQQFVCEVHPEDTKCSNKKE